MGLAGRTVHVPCSASADDAFGPVVRGCRDDFDFTLTFEQCCFAIAPSAAMLLMGSVRLYVLGLCREKRVQSTADALKWTKVAALFVFAVLQLTLIILWATTPSVPARSYGLAATAMSLATSALMVQLSPLEHTRSLRPSSVLGVYLFFSWIFDAVILRTVWLLPSVGDNIRATFTTAFAVKGVVLLLEAKSKREHIDPIQSGSRTPEETINVYAQSLFWWMNRLIMSGFKKILKVQDLYPIQEHLRAETLDQRFWLVWQHYTASSQRGKRVLLVTVTRALGWQFLLPIFPRLGLLALTFCQPLLIRSFLTYLGDAEELSNPRIGYGFIGAYGLVYIGLALASSLYWQAVYRSLTMLRGMLVAAIYKKTMDIGATTLENDAKVVTLMGTDVERIVRGMQDMHELWANLVTIALATWLLKTELGVACIGPIIVTSVSVGATLYAASFTAKRQKRWMGAIEKRISTISAVLGSMKSVKMTGLATKVSQLIHNLRLDEIKAARSFWVLGVYSSTIAMVPQTMSPVAAFGIFTADAVHKGAVLNTARLFTSLSLLLILTQPLFELFESVTGFASALGCFTRLQEYLLTAQYHDSRDDVLTEEGDAVRVADAVCGWTSEGRFSLSGISFKLPKSQQLFVIGPVAAGKSTLLKMLLGELRPSAGEVQIFDKSVAYCDQTPWLSNATIKDNIIGHTPLDQACYKVILSACALEPDLQELQDGDQTRIGSKGVALSSGQKHRIALARAVYSRKPIMLLDGIFGQLDSSVQITIFASLFGRQGLFRQWGTTVILTTHDVHFLPFADAIMCLDGTGRQVEYGTFDQLKKNDGYVEGLVRNGKVDEQIRLPPVKLDDQELDEKGTLPSPRNTNETRKFHLQKLGNEDALSTDVRDENQSKEPQDKSRQRGDFATYRHYFASLGWPCIILFAMMQTCYAFFIVFPTVWLQWWSSKNTEHPSNQQNGQYIGGYAGLQGAAILSAAALTWFSFCVMAQRAALQLHTQMLTSIMRAPMSLFQKTDAGAIVTRFSQDFQFIDSRLPLAIMGVVQYLFICIGEAGLIASASAWIVISYPVVILAVYGVQQFYLRTSRQLRLLDLEEKAPLYTQFLETIEGLATLRGFGWQNACVEQNHVLIDNAQKPFYLLYMVQKWLALVLDLLVAGLAVLVVGIIVALRNKISAGFTGVSLTQIISLTGFIKLMIQYFTSMETSLGAVSRIMQFTSGTEDEIKTGGKSHAPEDWPSSGEIILQNVSAVYRSEKSNHLALHNICMHVKPAEKIAVCGRTGSGKTSLILSLFSMIELSNGSIIIDGKDISTLRKDDLRARLNAVPDDPFLFQATFRTVINPEGNATDEQILQALAKVGVSKLLKDGSGGLDAMFKPEHMSHGQKQMFALARAMLRPCGNVLVLDEATSRTDQETSRNLHKLIRQEFAGSTIIAIVHRISDLKDWDRVAVIDAGRLVEFDSPEILLARDGSAFRRLCEAYKAEEDVKGVSVGSIQPASA